MTDLERLRLRRAGFTTPDPDVSSLGSPAFVGKVASAAANIAVGKFLLVNPTDVLGTELEGGTGTFTSASVTVPAYLIGPGKPATGDYLVTRFVDHRWVVEYTGGSGGGGGGGVLLPNCFCLTPYTLNMISDDETCNYGMFQSCTLQYGPPPASMAVLGYTQYIYTSPELFTDQITGSQFFYYFSCLYNQFFLSRIFPVSPLGDGYRDGILYSWIVGGYGNQCKPFQLEYGAAFPGSDATCSVRINGDIDQVPPGDGYGS